MTVGGVDLIPFGKRVAKEFSADDISGLAAELSYRFLLALFPFFIFLAALGGFAAAALSSDDPTQRLMNQIGDALPADARSILEDQVRGVLESRSGGLLSVGIIGAIWASSGAMKALIKALNRVYDVPETRSFWKSTSLAIAMTFAGSVCILGSCAVARLPSIRERHRRCDRRWWRVRTDRRAGALANCHRPGDACGGIDLLARAQYRRAVPACQSGSNRLHGNLASHSHRVRSLRCQFRFV